MWYIPDEGARDLEVQYLRYGDMLYKSGVHVPKVTTITPGDLRAVRED